MNKAAVLGNLVRISKISDKTDKFLLNFRNLFLGTLFLRTKCISIVSVTQLCTMIPECDVG